MVAGRQLMNDFEAPDHNTRLDHLPRLSMNATVPVSVGSFSPQTLSTLRFYRLQHLNVLLPRYSYQMRKKDFTDTPD